MEGAIIFASLIVGVAITDQLVSLHRLLRVRHLVHWDPLALIVAFVIQLTIIMVWWGIAGPSDETITIGEFLPTFILLVFLFLLASASLPDRADGTEGDLRRYYDENSGYIWTLFSLAFGFVIMTAVVKGIVAGRDLAEIAERQGVESLFLAAMISLILVRKRWFHWVIIAVLATGPIGWLSRSLG